MRRPVHAFLSLLVIIVALLLDQRAGDAAEMRSALVIGNDQYRAAPLATPANDAGLVADALQAAGFTVTGARDLDQATLRETFREFLDQVSAAGPDAVAVVYLAGYGFPPSPPHPAPAPKPAACPPGKSPTPAGCK